MNQLTGNDIEKDVELNDNSEVNFLTKTHPNEEDFRPETPVKYAPPSLDDPESIIEVLSDFYLSLERNKQKHDEYIDQVKAKLADLTSADMALQEESEANNGNLWMAKIFELMVEMEAYNRTVSNIIDVDRSFFANRDSQFDDNSLFRSETMSAAIQAPPEGASQSVFKRWLCAVFGC